MEVKKHGLVTAFGSPERGAARSLFGQGNVSYYEAGYYQEPSYRQSWDHYYEGSLEYPAAQESHHRTSPYRNQPNALNYYENDYMVDNRRRSNSKPRQNNNSHQPSVYPNLMTTPAYQADYTPKPRQKRVYKRPSGELPFTIIEIQSKAKWNSFGNWCW